MRSNKGKIVTKTRRDKERKIVKIGKIVTKTMRNKERKD